MIILWGEPNINMFKLTDFEARKLSLSYLARPYDLYFGCPIIRGDLPDTYMRLGEGYGDTLSCMDGEAMWIDDREDL